MELGKVPPNDIEAEQAILGSMLTDKDAVISAIEVLKEEDFYRADNRAIYGAILNLYSRAEPIDIITVKAEKFRTTEKSILNLILLKNLYVSYSLKKAKKCSRIYHSFY